MLLSWLDQLGWRSETSFDLLKPFQKEFPFIFSIPSLCSKFFKNSIKLFNTHNNLNINSNNNSNIKINLPSLIFDISYELCLSILQEIR